MTLAANNITPRLVNTELGSPFGINDLTVKAVCEYASQNPFSFYGPWLLNTDINKNVIIVYGTNNHRLGDFRSYNHSAATPAAANDFTFYWGPGGTTFDIPITSLPGQLNVLAADSNAQYITYNAYLSTANRTAETPRHDQDINPALFNTITALNGHIRTQTQRVYTTYIDTFVGMLVAGLSTPNDIIYMDTFFSDNSGNRLVNLGSVSGGYTDITVHERQPPEILSGLTIPSPPSGYTVMFPVIAATSGNCLDDSPLAGGTVGTTTISFYFGIHGIYGLETRSVEATSVTIQIMYDGEYKNVVLGTVSHSSKTSVSTSLPGSKTWQYDKDAEIWVVAATFASTPNYVTC
jgi:hypothetical protein